MCQKREIPWLKVIQFHKEIVQMSQDDFFALQLGTQKKLNSHRWTLIDKFIIEDMAGPWEIPYESITNESLLEIILNKNVTGGYLGGPCWISKIENTPSVECLNPLFYINVKLELDEEFIRIIPSEGNWDLSPKIYEILSRSEIEPEKALEDIKCEIIEKAHIHFDGNERNLSQHLICELFNCIPELEKIFVKISTKNENLKSINYPWVFFLPPTSSTPYTHYILQDYSELEKQLRENPSLIGGLKLLEYWPSFENGNKLELLPIVPLNDSQKMAVSEILKSKPVTVISGPPGCGKSQVVVSLLLNAWANNISVLFSSTTNAAVDVVFDRLSNFDCEYPIAIRAGSRSKNNIDEAFRRILNNVSANIMHSELGETEKRINELASKKEEIQSFLNKKIPQEVTEALRSALTSHTDFLDKKREIELEKEKFSREINAIGYNLSPESFTETIYIPFQNWMEGIKKCQYQIELDSQQRIEIENKLNLTIKKRNIALQKFCLNPDNLNNFAWIITDPCPERFEKWLKSYHSVINQTTPDYLNPKEMKEEFLEWQGEEEAIEWINKADRLMKEIQIVFTNYSKQHRSINEIRNKLENKKNELIAAGLLESTNYDKDRIIKWKTEYANLSSIPSGIIHIFKKKKANKKIRETEDEIRNYYPVGIWSHFGEDEQKGRELLNEVIDKSLSWIEIQEEWNSQKKVWEVIESEFISLQSEAFELDLSQKLDIADINTLLKLSKEIELKKKVAFQAAEMWEKKQKTDLLNQNLIQVSQEFQRLLSSTFLLDSWMNSHGLEFKKSVSSLLPYPTQETLIIAQRTLNIARFDSLISSWKDARESEDKVQDYTKIINQIPSDKVRIFSWWNEKPPQIAIDKLDNTLLPQKDDLLWSHLDECNKIAKEWKECSETTLAVMNKEMKGAYEWAVKYLTIAVNKIPEHMGKTRIESVILPLIERSTFLWPIDELNELFVDLDPERIKVEINKLDSELETLSFTLAKECWEKRVVKERIILDSLEALYNHYRKNHNDVKGFSPEMYRKALSSVPVWTTTALSPQSVPMEPEIFDLLVIDEASQCTLTNILPLIYRAKRLAIIGDPNQLPAIPNISMGKELSLASKHGVSKWLDLLGHNSNNIYQIGVNCLPRGRAEIISLIEHYRSHPLIIGFSNHYIYQKRLKLKKELLNEELISIKSGVFGRNVSGVCIRGSAGKSWINHKEIKAVCELIQDLQSNDELSQLSIGVVSPFAAQVKGIKDKLNELSLNNEITVGTAHTFQGDERDIIIFSPVIARGIEKGAMNFANSPNLINVALTRARGALFIIGDFTYCKSNDGIIGNFMKYVDTVMLLRDTSREELELFSWLIIEGLTPQVHVMIGGIEVDFLLINKSSGVKLVIEVDGKQHYFVEINGDKYTVKFEVNRRYIEINNEPIYVQALGNQEFVEIQGNSYPVTQTTESIKEDNIRDEYLKGQGFRVLRVPAKAVRETPTNVIARIKQHLGLDE
jgi:very-short-patch-repair endonuclease/GTP cyclohydrolase I